MRKRERELTDPAEIQSILDACKILHLGLSDEGQPYVPFEGKVACQYGMSYRSLMGMGTAEIITDTKEKEYGLSVLMRCQTGKDFTFDERLVSIVNVVKITVDQYSAKKRPLPGAVSTE